MSNQELVMMRLKKQLQEAFERQRAEAAASNVQAQPSAVGVVQEEPLQVQYSTEV